ncbi:phage tail protein [Bordetella genomosp. 10]|uniref:Phage tail protein n=1 Tax=Bordetella genomosp. 10 TaxID=1416804 RepID=A0A261S3K1_9BORD|nr:phage tail length tape measure family protein [Bordetella genomosp. 10]OZI31731.1 phage tail protein [Bordetella genomosp. 10]
MSELIAEGVVAVTGDASGLNATMAEVTQQTGKAKKSIEDLGRGASQSLTKAANDGDQATRKMERSTQSLINQIERQIAVTQAGAKGTAEYYQAIAQQRGVDPNQLKPYLDQLKAVSVAQGDAGMSAKALTAATRSLPAQFTDIAVSLQGGQRPMTVLLQQGGQLKDMFGGIAPAARAMAGYVAGLVNPFTLAAAAGVALAAAYSQGAAEAQRFRATVLQTGAMAGQTADQLQQMARRVSDVIGTQGRAAEVLDQFARTTKVGASNMEAFAAAAIRWENATGTAAEDTVKAFIEIGKAPLDAVMKLNEGMNFLTASTYEQIRSLERQGQVAQAAAVAQKAYADALNDRAPKLQANLGTLERAWESVKSVAKSAWDAMLDIGRPGTLEDRISKQAAVVQNLGDKLLAQTARSRPTGQLAAQLAAAQAEQDRLEKEYFAEAAQAAAGSARRQDVDRASFRADYLNDASRNSPSQQRVKAVQQEQQAFEKAIAGLKEGTEEYRQVYEAHRTALDAINKQFDSKGTGSVGGETEAARLTARIAEEKALSSELAERGLQTSKLNEFERRSAEIGELLKGNVKGQVRASLERTQALAAEAGALVRANTETKAFLESRDKYFADMRDGIAKITQEAQATEDQVATYGMSKAALEQLTIARLEDRKAALQGFDGAQEEIDLINQEIDARQRLASAVRAKDVKDAQKKANEDYVRDWQKTVDQYGDVFRQGFAAMLNNGKAGWKSFTTSLVTTFKTTVADAIYKMFLQPIVVNLVGNMAGLTGTNLLASGASAVSSLSGTGSSGASGLAGLGMNTANIFSLARTAYSALTGGITASLASGISSIGSAIGSTAAQQFALGMTGQGATLAAGLAGPTTAGSTAAGLGSMASSAIPVVGWIAAGAMLSKSLYKQGWDADNGTMAPIAMYNPITGPSLWTDKVLKGMGLSGELASMLSGSSTIARLFGMGPVKYGDTTLVGDFGTLGFNGYTSTPWKQKGGLFRSNKSGTQIGTLDDSFIDQTNAAFDQMKANAAALAQVVGVSAKSLDTYSEEIRVKLGKDNDENQKLIEDAITAVGENMVRSLVPNIADFAKEGEAASATLARLGSNLTAANQALKLLDLKLFDVSVSGAATASKLVDAFGSIDAMTQATQQYYQQYYSESERAKLSLASMNDQLKGLNIVLPDTMEEFRAMVSALDLTTDSGQAAYAALLAVAPEFAAVVQSTTQQGQQMAAAILAAYTGHGGVAPAMDAAAVSALVLADTLNRTSTVTGQISRLFLDLTSGLLDFESSTSSLDGTLTGAQQASSDLGGQIELLRQGLGGTIIDFKSMGEALANVDADVFVSTVNAAFQQLADRMKSLLDSIGNERMSVRQSARDILDPAPMSPAAIRAAIAGINTALPTNAGVLQSAAALNAADALSAQRVSERNTAEQTYNAVQAAHDKALADVAAAQKQADDASAWLSKLNWDIYAPKTVPYKKKNWEELDAARSVAQAQLPAAQQAYNDAQAALQAALDRSNNAPSDGAVWQAQAAYTQSVINAANAQAAATQAAKNARDQQLAYADSLQQFALDATKSVATLSDLRDQTVKYYEAQKALATALSEGAATLRKTVKDYRVSQLDPEDQFNVLQSDFAAAYAKAMGSNGDDLTAVADQLNGMLQPLLEAAQSAFSSDTQYQSFIATTLARAEAVAGRMDAVAPQGYEQQSIDLLGQIDTTLAALESSALSGDEILANAINAAKDATVNGLRQVVNALTGKPVAAFAAGGDHAGGLRLVGENGPELEVTGPSRIFNAQQTQSILADSRDQGEMIAALHSLLREQQALREELAGLRIEARAAASNTAKTARQLDRIEADGLLVRTESDEPLAVVEVQQA